MLRRIALILGALALVVQFVPLGLKTKTVATSGTHVAETIDPLVGAIFDRACQDCHSSQAPLPWYGHVAPVSWILSRDVTKGREKLDFALWAERAPSTNERMEICDAVSDGAMPLRAYTMIHRNARLSKRDVDMICDWTDAPASTQGALHAHSSNTARTPDRSKNARQPNMRGPR